MPTDAPAAGEMPNAPSLLRSGAFSLVTSAAPIIVALVALPILTRQLGTERLGLLALAWAWLSYAALLDFGLGRALTRLVAASDAGEALDAPIGAFVATAHVVLAAVGALVGLVGALVAPWYVTRVLQVSLDLRQDAITSALIFALSVPLVTGASVPRAVLEARHRFRDVNFVRLPVSVGTFAVPLLLLPFTASLTAIAVTLAVIRAWAWWRYTALSRAVMPTSVSGGAARRHLRPLLRAGAWLTVSNVLSPLMTVADRFLIGSSISVSAVALYAVPWEAVTKLWIVPGALMMVLFPAMSRAAAAEPRRLVPLHNAGIRLIALIVVPVCAVAALLAPTLLSLAGGRQYVGDSVVVLRILAIGVAANCIGIVPVTMLQASGRARWVALVHLAEVMPFLALIVLCVSRWSIIGAATAWTARVVVDAVVMARRAHAVAPLPASTYVLAASGVIAVAACAWTASVTSVDSRAPIVAAILIISACPVALWTQRRSADRQVLSRAGGLG